MNAPALGSNKAFFFLFSVLQKHSQQAKGGGLDGDKTFTFPQQWNMSIAFAPHWALSQMKKGKHDKKSQFCEFGRSHSSILFFNLDYWKSSVPYGFDCEIIDVISSV